MSRYWCRFIVDDDASADDPRPFDPDTAPPWGCSGHTAQGPVVCALVDARSAPDAEAIVRQSWPIRRGEIVTIDHMHDGWMPEPTRWACIHRMMQEQEDGR